MDSERKKSGKIKKKTKISALNSETQAEFSNSAISPNLKIEISNEEHRSARRLVFEKIVAATIQDPNHPYYSLLPQNLRQEMIEEITDQLVDSHYLNA